MQSRSPCTAAREPGSQTLPEACILSRRHILSRPSTVVSHKTGPRPHCSQSGYKDKVTTASTTGLVHSTVSCQSPPGPWQPSLPLQSALALLAALAGPSALALGAGTCLLFLLLPGLGTGLFGLCSIGCRPDRVWGAAHHLGDSGQACKHSTTHTAGVFNMPSQDPSLVSNRAP